MLLSFPAPPDLVPAHVQAPRPPPPLPLRRAHVPARVCDAPRRSAWFGPFLPPVAEHPAALEGGSSHQGQQELVSTAAEGRVQRRQNRAEESAAADQLPRVGRYGATLLQQKGHKQNDSNTAGLDEEARETHTHTVLSLPFPNVFSPLQNKTIRAVFNNKHVLELMEKNYRTFCALNGIQPATSEQVKEVILKICEQTELGDKRSSKLTQDDFLKLLASFNQAGFHFTGVGVDEPEEDMAE